MTPDEVRKSIAEMVAEKEEKDRQWVANGGVLYRHEDIIAKLKDALHTYETADDCGTVDFCFGRLQLYFQKMEPILDENGGI